MKKGTEIEFNCYGQTVKGTFIENDGDLIRFNCTYDALLKENEGTIQTINKSHLISH